PDRTVHIGRIAAHPDEYRPVRPLLPDHHTDRPPRRRAGEREPQLSLAPRGIRPRRRREPLEKPRRRRQVERPAEGQLGPLRNHYASTLTDPTDIPGRATVRMWACRFPCCSP